MLAHLANRRFLLLNFTVKNPSPVTSAENAPLPSKTSEKPFESRVVLRVSILYVMEKYGLEMESADATVLRRSVQGGGSTGPQSVVQCAGWWIHRAPVCGAVCRVVDPQGPGLWCSAHSVEARHAQV